MPRIIINIMPNWLYNKKIKRYSLTENSQSIVDADHDHSPLSVVVTGVLKTTRKLESTKAIQVAINKLKPVNQTE